MRDDRIRGPMRVAVLHDHLRFIGGGERVALTLASAFDADTTWMAQGAPP